MQNNGSEEGHCDRVHRIYKRCSGSSRVFCPQKLCAYRDEIAAESDQQDVWNVLFFKLFSGMPVKQGQGCESKKEAEKSDREGRQFSKDVFTDNVQTSPENKSEKQENVSLPGIFYAEPAAF